jgi:hypothetical protein
MTRPYATEAERIEARRKSYRESKARKAAERNARRTAAEEWVTQLINRGTGPATRRVLMLEILDRRKDAA